MPTLLNKVIVYYDELKFEFIDDDGGTEVLICDDIEHFINGLRLIEEEQNYYEIEKRYFKI